MTLPPLLKAMRPEQWSKNALVAAAAFFAAGDRTLHLPPNAPLLTSAAFLLFCLLSSSVYLINDLLDRELDRLHPTKRLRPIAAGALTPASASRLALALAASALAGALLLAPILAGVLASYLLLQLAYSLFLKRIPHLDVLILSAGFALRALAGAVVLPVPVSPWLLLCTFLLALFLALCKRRHEKTVLHLEADRARPSLRNVDSATLDRLINALLLLNALAYALYTLSPESVEKYGGYAPALTLPFVVYGLARYRNLVQNNDQGGKPEVQLFRDPHLLATYFAYVLTLLLLWR